MPIINFPNNAATPKQILYIEQLSIDLGFDRDKRNRYASHIVGKKINYLDELTKSEATQVIGRFKVWKEGVE